MARIKLDGQWVEARNLGNPTLLGKVHLQHVTGMRLDEIRKVMDTLAADSEATVDFPFMDGPVDGETAAEIITVILSVVATGVRPTLDEVLAVEIGGWEYTAAEQRQISEALAALQERAEQDPPVAGTGTPADDTPAVPAKRSSTRNSSGSSAKSRGSSTKSPSAS